MDRARATSRISHPELQGKRQLDRKIFALALPSLGSLVVEPLMTLADSAMVGHLGTAQLGGLTIGSTLLTLLVGICIFLAYTTTALTARKFGEGDTAGALRAGVDGIWLALVVGVALALLAFFGAAIGTAWMGGKGAVATYAVIYLRTSAPGLVAMLIVLATTGTLRGLLDTKTPFLVAAIGTAINVVLNAILIYGLNLGVAGSGIGTAISQWLMALALLFLLRRHARPLGVNLRPNFTGLRSASLSGAPLIIRSISLQLAIVVTVSVAAHYGQVVLAAHQIVKSIWTFALFGMDAIAIAAQALIGNALGMNDHATIRAVTRRTVYWGVIVGCVMLVVLAVSAPWLPWLFTSAANVRAVARIGLWVTAAFQPLCGVVFVLDGILIGANDTRYLAYAMLLCLAAQLFGLWCLSLLNLHGAAALAGIWCVYGIFLMGGRLLTLGLRVRTNAWQRN